MKIILLGGSFNPAHNGHIYISKLLYKATNSKKIWWLIAKHNPFKLKDEMLSFSQRITYAKKLTSDSKYIKVSDFEKKTASLETIDVLKKIIKTYKNYQFIWAMGNDNIFHFHKWKFWKNILKLMPIVIVSRNNNYINSKNSILFHNFKNNIFYKIPKKFKKSAIYLIRIKNINISSTMIRKTSTYSNNNYL